jgi:hypothetical protein
MDEYVKRCNMKVRIFVAAFLVCALSSVVVFGVSAQVGGLGVEAGDNFTYSFEAFWSSTNPSKVVPAEFSDLNRTRSININVTAVAGVVAYVNITKRMIDGSQVDTPGYISVVTGQGVEAQLFIIGANLTAGGKAYPLAEPPASAESFTITETVTLTYVGAPREVNHYHASTTNADVTITRDAYYDKATGILLEMTISHSFTVSTDETQTDSEHWKIIQLNEAVAPPDGTDGTDGTDSTEPLPQWILYAVLVVVAVVVAALIAVLILRRRKRPEVQAPATSAVQPSL